MKKFKSLVLAVIGLLCSMSVSAHDFEVDGIYYNITSSTERTVAVTYKGKYNDSFEEYYGSVVIPESVTYNGNTYAVTSIGEYAFWICYSLTSVELPNSVTSIEHSAISGCTSLYSVKMGACVRRIGNYAFYGCSSLTSVEIPNSVTSIGTHAFYDCSSLTSVEIPNSVTSIGACAFYGCSSLTSVEIPNRVTDIGIRAFSGCSGLISIVVDESNRKYDSRDNSNAIIVSRTNELLCGCKNTVIPNSVTSIGEGAFEECSSLTSIEIPNSVTSIGF